MQGKLVPQNPNDEPVKFLLEKIRAEKQELFEEGKIKKDICKSQSSTQVTIRHIIRRVKYCSY